MDSIYNVLNNYLKRSNKNSTNEVICRYMMNHLLEIPDLSVYEIAEACYTSHPSIIRFCKEIGFEGVADFKYNVQNYIDGINNQELRIHMSIDTDSDEKYNLSLSTWLNKQNNYCHKYLSMVDREKIMKLCRQIRQYENVCVFGAGVSNVVGELFRIELARCGKIINNIPADLTALDMVKAEDTLLIFISMYGYLIDKLNRELSQSGLKQYIKTHADQSWLVTLNGSGLNQLTDEVVCIGNRESDYGETTNLMILFFEIVAECYQNIYPK